MVFLMVSVGEYTINKDCERYLYPNGFPVLDPETLQPL